MAGHAGLVYPCIQESETVAKEIASDWTVCLNCLLVLCAEGVHCPYSCSKESRCLLFELRTSAWMPNLTSVI